jgi:hypothetical protein
MDATGAWASLNSNPASYEVCASIRLKNFNVPARPDAPAVRNGVADFNTTDSCDNRKARAFVQRHRRANVVSRDARERAWKFTDCDVHTGPFVCRASRR